MLNIVMATDIRLISRNGESENWGRNVDGHPAHAFRYPNPTTARQPLRATIAGTDRWVAGCFRQRLRSDVCVLECITAGSLHCQQGSWSRLLQAGDIFVIRIGLDHQMTTGPDGHLDKHTLAAAGPLLPGLLAQLDLHRAHTSRPSADNFHRLCALIEDIAARIENDDCGAAVYEAFRLAATGCREDEPTPVLATALAHIDRHRGPPLPLPKLAAVCNVSPATLNRHFKQRLATTAVAYQNERRLQRAAELLHLSDERVRDIAKRCGWSDPLRFSAAFKQRFGRSPRDFRKGQ